MKKIIKKYIKINIIYKKNIKIINKKFRKKNKITDVITFKYTKNKTVLADIFIYKKIIIKKNKNIKKIIIHSMLHILSYDHTSLKDNKIMTNLEKVIGMSGIEPPTITTSK